MPSTCPWTRWPPSRASRVTGRSRFTGDPATSAPSDERSSVSCMTSAVNSPSPCSTTVRQTPLTAMDAPWTASAGDDRAADAQPDGVALRFHRDDAAELLDDAGEHSVLLVGPEHPGVDPYVGADERDVGHRRDATRPRSCDMPASASAPGPAPSRAGATYQRTASTSPARTKAAARVGAALEQHVLHVAGAQLPAAPRAGRGCAGAAWAPRRRARAHSAGTSRRPTTTRSGCGRRSTRRRRGAPRGAGRRRARCPCRRRRRRRPRAARGRRRAPRTR